MIRIIIIQSVLIYLAAAVREARTCRINSLKNNGDDVTGRVIRISPKAEAPPAAAAAEASSVVVIVTVESAKKEKPATLASLLVACTRRSLHIFRM